MYDGNSQNMHLRPNSLLGAFTTPNDSRVSEIVNMLVLSETGEEESVGGFGRGTRNRKGRVKSW